jgi:hypothetical protein
MPDAQQRFLKLVELGVKRKDLCARANQLWKDGKQEQAKKLARKVVAIEERIKRLAQRCEKSSLHDTPVRSNSTSGVCANFTQK